MGDVRYDSVRVDNLDSIEYTLIEIRDLLRGISTKLDEVTFKTGGHAEIVPKALAVRLAVETEK